MIAAFDAKLTVVTVILSIALGALQSRQLMLP